MCAGASAQRASSRVALYPEAPVPPLRSASLWAPLSPRLGLRRLARLKVLVTREGEEGARRKNAIFALMSRNKPENRVLPKA